MAGGGWPVAALAWSLALLSGPARALGQPGVAVPLHALEHRCLDPRYPALAGPWAVGCGPGGLVDRAVNLESGALVELGVEGRSPALAEGAVLFVTPTTTILVRLERPEERATLSRSPLTLVAPPAFDGERLALVGEDQVLLGAPGERLSRRWEARPAGWYPPALAGAWVAWVEGGDGGEDVYAVDTSRAEGPRALAGGSGYQRHVVGSGTTLAWVEDEAVALMDTRTQELRRLPAKTGFSAPISLWGEVVCWEERGGADLDLRCSDGLVAGGPGHQEAPSRWGPWLLYRSGGRVWLLTAP